MATNSEDRKSELKSGTAPLPDFILKCFMSQDNIDRSKAHKSYCLYALPIKEAFLHEHNIPPGKSNVEVQEDGAAWATLNGVRYLGQVPQYKLAQELDAAAASGDQAKLDAAKTAINPHAFEMVFVPHHHLHVPIKKAKPETNEATVSQATGSQITLPATSPQQPTAKKKGPIAEKLVTKKQERKALKQSVEPTPKRPEQRTAHRAKPFLPEAA
jgi:hypothetical protein